jgi:uncharacterized protein YecE (DUF72 family)
MDTGLNAVELNSSFYHFPYKNNIASWKRKSDRKLRWSVKVNRSITHIYKLNEKSYDLWERFAELFSQMNDLIDFFLFQLPPSFKGSKENMERIERFIELSGIEERERIAIEPRDESWFDYIDSFMNLGVTIVSVDCPDFQWFVRTSDFYYLRLHGHREWYAYVYSEEELKDLAEKQRALGCRTNYAFFNNDIGMLENAKTYKSTWFCCS